MTQIDEIGEKIALSVRNFFDDERNIEIVNRLKNAGLQFVVEEKQISDKEQVLAGKSFVADCQQPVPVRCSACRGTGCDEPRSYTHNGMRIQRQKCGKCKGSGKIFR